MLDCVTNFVCTVSCTERIKAVKFPSGKPKQASRTWGKANDGTLLSSELRLTRYMYHTVGEARGPKRGR